MTFKTDQTFKRGAFEVIVDYDERTKETRVSVYRGETLLAIEFIQNVSTVIDRLVETAKLRAPQFPVTQG